ncbi:28S rRNA (cytosine-C(5))-methyltransferase-like [Ptychodera flava]|uniref:28S rRNA (cytosine-C(5))-methyltransferase-like n=1 Tax=Ptychodera flava TaxID=63121 RepID=UPI00396AA584
MLYVEASRIISIARHKKGSVKSLVNSSKLKHKKQLNALVCGTLKYASITAQIIKDTKLLQHEKYLKKKPILAEILVYEHLFGKGLKCGGKLKSAIYSHKNALQAALSRLKVKAKVKDAEDLLPQQVKQQVLLPRYVRVNLLKTSVDDVIQQFKAQGFTLTLSREVADEKVKRLSNSKMISDLAVSLIESLKPKQFMVDIHLFDVLIFPPKTDLHDHVLYSNGHIILQDKASCIPAHVLSPGPGSHVIDACAAPGNKTSHLSSLMNNTGKIFAFDLDSKRLGTMRNLMGKAGVVNSQLYNEDFLRINPESSCYQKVEFILVDPSCSGSGIVSRNNHFTEDTESDHEYSKKRLQSLMNFQLKI